MKVYVEPRFDHTQDSGEGGIKQVIGHVAPVLEARGVEFVDKPDLADLVWYHASPYATTRRYLEAHPEVPVVASCHGLYWAEYAWDAGSLDANAEVAEGIRLADVVTAPTEWVAHAIRRGVLADVRVVPHGVDPEEWSPRPVDASAGRYALYDKTRVDPVCDPSPVIELARRMPQQQFVLTGDPPVDLPNVLKLGRIPYAEARELTRGAGVYLCVTRETFGLATLQAMAAGVPVVGWRYGGQAEFVGAGGLLVEPGDIDALSRALVVALEQRETIGANARQVAAGYTWELAAQGYLAAFRDAVAAHASRGRVSIITTAYNAERTVARTIASARAAMGPDDELIVVDDASTDGTRRAIVEAKDVDPRVVFIAREENGYLAQARNDALRVARGRYVTCLDADDELTPEALDLLAGELDKERTTQVAYGKVRFLDDTVQEDGSVTSQPAQYHDQQGRPLAPGASQWPFPFDWDVQNRGDNVTCMPYSSMVRTAWLRRAGGWRTRCRTGEDLDLWMRLVSYGARPRMVTQADVLVYHTSTSSMSVTNRLPRWGLWYPWTDDAGRRCSPPWGVPFPPPPQAKRRAWPVSHHAEPRVTVVIPVGPGHERYVLDAIDSVHAQTLRSWECVVVNDTDHGDGYSTGWTWNLPPWVRFLYNPDIGVAAARNHGIANARAPYVVFLDADDYLDRDALEYLVAALDRHPDLAVVYPDYWERDPEPDKQRPDRVNYAYGTRTELPDWDCDKASQPGALYGVTAIYRTDALKAVKGFDVTAENWEDGDLQVALAYAGYCAAKLPRRAFVYCRDRGAVATWHHADRAERETKIRAWFEAKYKGRTSMACGSCGGAPVHVPVPVVGDGGGGEAVVLSGDMVEVAYIGERSGDFWLRGRSSGAQYRFGKGKHSRKAVLREDLEFFVDSAEFRVELEGPRQADGAPPDLTVDGPPHGKRASVA